MNSQGRFVPKRAQLAQQLPRADGGQADSGSSGRGAGRRAAERPPADRRVVRTQQALTHALVELVLAKRYAAITVQDLLDKADVGRSTFYAHYRSKDDLLLQSFVHMLDLLDAGMGRSGTADGRVAPVRELFAHVAEFTPFHRALTRAHMLERLFQAGSVHMSQSIGRRLAAMPRAPGAAAVPLPVAAQAHAGALFALLRWWIEQDRPHTAEQMDGMFHFLVRGRAAGG